MSNPEDDLDREMDIKTYRSEKLAAIERKIADKSLRDYFAGQALIWFGSLQFEDHVAWKDVAVSCYDMADKMLLARGEEK